MSRSSALPTLRKEDLRRASLHVGLGGVILLTLLIYALAVGSYSQHPPATDFLRFHWAAENLLQGEDIYELVPLADFPVPDFLTESGQEFFHPPLNPPFQTVLSAPLGLLEFQPAFRAWAFFSILCGLLAAVLIGWKTARRSHRITACLVLGTLLLAYFPTWVGVTLGQWGLVPLLFLVVSWLAWREGKLALAGGILGAVAAVKLFFGAFFLLFLARREWRAAVSFVAVWLACTVISVAITGPEAFARYLDIMGEIDWYSASWNASFLGFFSRVFGEPGNDPLVHMPRLGSILGRGCGVLAILLLMLMANRKGHSSSRLISDDLAFSGCIVIMLLASPFGWIYYFPFLLIPLTVIWTESGRSSNRRTLRLLTILIWLLSSVPGSLVQASQIDGDPGLILGWAGVYFYALALFLGVIWVMRNPASPLPVET